MPLPLGAQHYPRIGDHGVIGDQRTAALVALDGTIDFWCAPEFDSPTIFASLLDADRGGRFAIEAVDGTPISQRYVRDTNVLVTSIRAGSATVEVVDFMPLERTLPSSRIVRVVTVRGGPATIRVRCSPRFDYARAEHTLSVDGSSAELRSDRGALLRLTANAPLVADGADLTTQISLTTGERAFFVLEQPGTRDPQWDLQRATRAMRRTIVHWRRWIGRAARGGAWSSQVRRSALALALLHSRRTGAVIAAPTFGLPEQIGGSRNWDFRYSWIRDASFIVFALTRLGLRLEGRAFAAWIADRCLDGERPGELQSMYGIDGRRILTEQVLDHLEGYRGSRPVRIGNAAYAQLQLDIYGELLDALYVLDEQRKGTSRALWARIVDLLNWVADNWTRPDQGIWEVRGGAQEFLYSRVMCWVALDRGMRIGRRRRFPAPFDHWRIARDAIRRDIDQNFWNAELGAFVGSKGANAIDAACLIMPLVGFIESTEPRWSSTLSAIERRLVRNGLVRRYDLPGMDTDAGADRAPSFTICSFWYVECLARAGRGEDARRSMEQLIGHANHLGLYSEDIGPDGDLLGNFPQGLTHLALIGAALEMERER
jgi:GH15 family glucan-1,4-alpha-glucosidase